MYSHNQSWSVSKHYQSDKTNLAMASCRIVLVAYGVEHLYQDQCALNFFTAIEI